MNKVDVVYELKLVKKHILEDVLGFSHEAHFNRVLKIMNGKPIGEAYVVETKLDVDTDTVKGIIEFMVNEPVSFEESVKEFITEWFIHVPSDLQLDDCEYEIAYYNDKTIGLVIVFNEYVPNEHSVGKEYEVVINE